MQIKTLALKRLRIEMGEFPFKYGEKYMTWSKGSISKRLFSKFIIIKYSKDFLVGEKIVVLFFRIIVDLREKDKLFFY